jgi:hypothetical protein
VSHTFSKVKIRSQQQESKKMIPFHEHVCTLMQLPDQRLSATALANLLANLLVNPSFSTV